MDEAEHPAPTPVRMRVGIVLHREAEKNAGSPCALIEALRAIEQAEKEGPTAT
ncbi:hypothetical protein [Bradyrhizobium sp. LMTR 3]|uniref:hypothetical protein n=1 Tax=Bradyrhizobium sp. LMTR 3 TaxID=189873 RepID=UPI00159EF606|nr:hypothetical protein [Bradyrhizobium sp. LMTR 3]